MRLGTGSAGVSPARRRRSQAREGEASIVPGNFHSLWCCIASRDLLRCVPGRASGRELSRPLAAFGNLGAAHPGFDSVQCGNRIGDVPRRGEREPFESLGQVLWHSLSDDAALSEGILGQAVALLGGLSKPLDRLPVVPLESPSVNVHYSQAVLCGGIPL